VRRSELAADERFASGPDRPRNKAALFAELEAIFATDTP
jgi:crotonobetainyl-CoA:carnitine CoA-transferase CaiB-like acyl-CoA transferase